MRDEADLKHIGDELKALESPKGNGYETKEKRENIKQLVSRRRNILNDFEEQWRLKSRAIWLSEGMKI